jgi:hypothetical protein
LSDDANLGALLYNLDEFNDGIHTDIHLIVDAFVSWFEHDLTRKYFKKEFKMRNNKEDENNIRGSEHVVSVE